MSVARLWGSAIVVLVAWGFASRGQAAEPGDRLGAVVAARVEMQRQLGEWLTKSLQGAAEPYRVDAVVRVELRGNVREVRARQESASPAVKIGGKSRVKLPGLGMVDGGGGGAPLMPEINIEGGTRTTEQVTRQLETEVTRVSVMLFVDPAMPKDRRALIARLAGELSGVDRARGDDVVVEERPPAPAPAPIAATSGEGARKPWELLAVCATAIVAAFVLAVGLARRGGAAGGGRAEAGAAGDRQDGPAAAEGTGAVAAAVQARRRREELGAFRALADASSEELVQVVSEVDARTAVAIVDLFGLDDGAAALLDVRVSAARRAEIGLGLASARILPREQLAEMEDAAEGALKRVRNRVALGGPSRLAEFLAGAPAAVRAEVLRTVAEREPALAAAARGELLLFEDLARLDDASIRRVVTGLDPAAVALALAGADGVREVVLGAVSPRLRGILAVEGEHVSERSARDVEQARRGIEVVMRALRASGSVRPRTAPESAAAAA